MQDKINFEIQALRGLAISFAVISHLGGLFFFGNAYFHAVSAFLNFWIGVDIFFCISGYVIFISLIRERSLLTTKISFLNFAGYFWIKRFWRLAPSAWFWAVTTILLSFLFHKTGDESISNFGSRLGNLSDAIAIFFHVANIHFWQCHTEARNCGINEFYWSLSLEEQFYIIVPFLFFFLKKERLIQILSLIIILQLFIFFRSTWTFWGVIRTDGFAIGALLAIFKTNVSYEFIKPKFLISNGYKYFWIIFWIFMTLLLPMGSLSFNISPFGLGLATLSIGIIIWTASYNEGYFLFPKPLSNVLIFLGNRSYSLYLCHMTVIYLIREIIDRLGIQFIGNIYLINLCLLLLFIIFILLFTEFNYRLIEIPFRDKGRLYAQSFRNRFQ
jgi:peptidoglycan/LPS O-acetylase OafA/YrhL